jgi:hypothetical protein
MKQTSLVVFQGREAEEDDLVRARAVVHAAPRRRTAGDAHQQEQDWREPGQVLPARVSFTPSFPLLYNDMIDTLIFHCLRFTFTSFQ